MALRNVSAGVVGSLVAEGCCPEPVATLVAGIGNVVARCDVDVDEERTITELGQGFFRLLVFSQYPGTASDGIEADVVRGQFDNWLTYFPPCEDLVRIGCVGKVLDREPKASTIACVGGVDAGENVDANVVGAFPELCAPMFLADGGMRAPLTTPGCFDARVLFGYGDDCTAQKCGSAGPIVG